MTHKRDADHSIHVKIMTGTTSTPDLNEEREKGLEDGPNISDQEKA
jgi:hypothetical protein